MASKTARRINNRRISDAGGVNNFTGNLTPFSPIDFLLIAQNLALIQFIFPIRDQKALRSR